jgi:2'-5' RNA ligase
MPETIRAFIALEPPAHIVQTVEALQQELREKGLKLRWVRPKNIHLTLKFFGELAADRVDGVTNAMTRAAQDYLPATLSLQGLGVFPNRRRPKVLWMSLGGEVEQLGRIQDALEESLAAEGFERERRPFRAHLTLARMPNRFNPSGLSRALEAAGDNAPESFQCSELVLFQSRLDPRGAIYTPLARVALAGKAAEQGH